jgi:hypothetical protein
MAGGRFSKQADYLSAKYLNNVNDAQIGGTITGAPAGTNFTQGYQTVPGDRVILSPSDALALSNNSVGNLYTGTYRYVATRNNSTSSPVRGCGAFWDPTAAGNISSPAADKLYQVTSDGNAANYTNTLLAGVFINAITAGNFGWIQESGKVSAKFRNAITGTAAIGGGVYLTNPAPANNNATDNGSFDMLTGANIGAGPIAAASFYATIDGLLNTYVGVAETLPSNNNISLVDMTLSRSSFRW